ncbi:MAG: hypothetical protein IJ070_04135 [Firmicutes bacterium]|nr:hypothetical protein [Bacillota bacterium]MBQ9708531.1 hypothetical protein [Bacillota bacterium]
MSLGLIYLIVLAVSVVCGFLSLNRPDSKITMIAGAVMVAACIYATIKYSWFHILGFVGVTLVGLNVFSFFKLMGQRRAEEKERIDKIFAVDDDKDEKEE